MKNDASIALFDPWVLARQALERCPEVTADGLLERTRQREGALRTAHDYEGRLLAALTDQPDATVEAWMEEARVPAHLRGPFLSRRRNRREEGVRQEAEGTTLHYSTLYLPFGGFQIDHAGPPENPGWPLPGVLDIVSLLDEMSALLLPLFHFIADRQPPAGVHGAIPLCFPSLEEKGWPEAPFVTWTREQIGPVHHFALSNLQAGVLSLPVCAQDEVQLGVLLEQTQDLSAALIASEPKFSRYLGAAMPRHEAREDVAGGMSELWARWVFALTSRHEGHAEFAFEKGAPGQSHRFRATVRLRDTGGQVAQMLIHNVTFWQETTLARIVAPWLTTRASHLPWSMSVSHAAGFDDPRLASPVPFW